MKQRFKGPDQIWKRVEIRKKNECWPWTSKSVNEHGYGIVNWKGRTEKAHRIAYQLFYKIKLTKKQHLLHSCDNPRCRNPHHLSVGSQADNIHDCIKKGRHSPPPIRRGEANNKTKITQKDALKIRSLYASGKYTTTQLAKMFGLNSSTSISNIVNRKTWSWL